MLVDANKTDRVDLLVADIVETDSLEWAIFDTSSVGVVCTLPAESIARALPLSLYDSPGIDTYVAEHEGDVLSSVTITRHGDVVGVWAMGTMAVAQGKGIGRALLADPWAGVSGETRAMFASVVGATDFAEPSDVRELSDGAYARRREQALGAASRASIPLLAGEVEVEPAVSILSDEELCRGCGMCASICPYGAIEIVDTERGRKARMIEVACKGCGTCGAACPSGAMSTSHFTSGQMRAQVLALIGGDNG